MKKIISFSMIVMMIGFLMVAGCSKKSEQPTPQPVPAVQPPQVTEPAPEESMEKNVVEITAAGFSPKTITITPGGTVTWINKDTSPRRVASNIHLVHTTYPGSDIKKCGTPEQAAIFDACRGLNPGESYSFTFDRIGRWPYHDHLKPSLSGTVVVQE